MKLLCLLPVLAALALATARADLVAHWPLDDDAADATGNGHNGAVVGGTVNFGQPGANANTGTAAAFPDNGHIDVPYSIALNPGTQAPNGSGSFTVALWANASSNAGFNSPFTAREDNGATVNGPIIYNNNTGNWSYWAGNNGAPGAWNPLNGPAVPLNTWQHVAVTYDAATQTRKMFIDGSEVLTANLGVSANVLRDTHIGSGQDNGLNFYWNGLIDDVGLWDEALDAATIQSIMSGGIASGLPDPSLIAPNPVDLALDGSVQQFAIPITNNGATQDLTISSATFVGDPNFSLVSLPGDIAPGNAGDLTIAFDPSGSNGAFEADLEITSNDELSPVKTITVRGTIHDPMLVADATLDLGNSLAGSLIVTNDGASRTLNLTDLVLSGATDNFAITSFPPSLPAAGGTGNIEIAFDPRGGEGTFRAQLQITSDDPIIPVITVDLVARVPYTTTLVAWWPLDADGSDASGNGLDGTVVGTLNLCPGATGTTGGSLEFDGATTRIDVPYDEALNPDDFTVTLWANSDTAAGLFNSPITNRDDAPGSLAHGFILYNNNNGFWDFWTGDGDPGWDSLVGPAVVTGSWTHLAISYDSATDTKTLYVNGDVAATDNVPQSGVAQYVKNGTIQTEDLHIGAGQDNGLNFWFDGKLDDVALFRVPLTEADIENIMANGVAGFTGAAGLFQMLGLEFGPQPGQITVSWASQDGAKYALERATDLTAPGTTGGSWEELDDDIDGTGEVTSFIDSSPPAGAVRVYYRARRL